MKYRTRIYYNAEQKNLMWDRWQAGDSLLEIARLFDRGTSAIQGVLSETGGIRPAPRRRAARPLPRGAWGRAARRRRPGRGPLFAGTLRFAILRRRESGLSVKFKGMPLWLTFRNVREMFGRAKK